MVELSRRRVLGGALLLAASATGCSFTSVGAQPSNMLLVGTSGRVRGGNITPGGPNDWGGDDVWAQFWSNWDWSGRIKGQIDDAHTLGANCIRLIGNTDVVTSGAITTATYLQRWTQFLDYTKSLGFWVYPCGGDLRHWGNTTLGAAEGLYRAWAGLLADYNHVIGVDITNECTTINDQSGGINYHQPEDWYSTIKLLGEVVRSVSGKPITHSRPGPASDWRSNSPKTDMLSDFIDVHSYYGPPDNPAPAATVADGLYASSWGAGKQLILGEFGVDTTSDSTARAALYNAIKDVINHSTNCVGALAWSIYDTGSTPDGQYGLYDGSRNLRQDIADVFVTFPVTR